MPLRDDATGHEAPCTNGASGNEELGGRSRPVDPPTVRTSVQRLSCPDDTFSDTVRVATYTQPADLTRGSLLALAILVATIMLGTSAASRLFGFFAPPLAPLVTFMWMGLYLLAFAGLMFSRGIDWVSWLARYRILLVVVLIGSVASVAWSVDARLSAERVVHLIGASLIGIYLGFTVPLMTMLRVFAVALGAIVLMSFPAALLFPQMGLTDYEGRRVWQGVMNSKNQLGFWAASGVLLYITLSDSTRSFWTRLLCYLFAGLCLILLVFSQSATALLAMVLAGAIALYLFIAGRFQLGFVQMGVIAVLFAALVALAFLNVDANELVGRSDDLTGRGEVWQQTWKLIMERPLGGYGYGSLWFPTDSTLWIQESLTDFTWVVYHAHNGFLQVASEIGLPLSILALLMVVQQLIEIFYCQYQRQQPGVLFVLAFMLAYLAGNFSEARFLVTRELYWVFFIALPISMLRQINLVAAEGGESGADTSRAPPARTGGGWAPGAAVPVGAIPPGIHSAYGMPRQPFLPGAAASNGRPATDAEENDSSDADPSDPTGGFVGHAVGGRWEDEAFDPPPIVTSPGGERLNGPADIDLGERASGEPVNGSDSFRSAEDESVRVHPTEPPSGVSSWNEDDHAESDASLGKARDASPFGADRFDKRLDVDDGDVDDWLERSFDDEDRSSAAGGARADATRSGRGGSDR